jgi:hypothetical protein
MSTLQNIYIGQFGLSLDIKYKQEERNIKNDKTIADMEYTY